jgi:hypothetical protein
MDDTGRMNELKSPKDLIEEVLNVLNLKLLLGLYHSIEVGLHQLTNQVDVSEDFSKS